MTQSRSKLDRPDATAPRNVEAQSKDDIRGADASRNHDMSEHRKGTWLFEDLLN